MIIGFFSDAHGNEKGFFTCYEYLRNHADSMYYLGDATGYFPLSNRIIDALRSTNIQSLKGNHDAMVLGELPYENDLEPIFQVRKSRELISVQNLHYLKELPSELRISIDNRHLLLVHGSPSDPLNGYIYPDTDTADVMNMPFDAIFMGHTHRAFIKKSGKMNIVNVGSCGFSRDIGNRITLAMYDTKKNEVALKEFPLNINETLKVFGTSIHPTVIMVLNRNNKNFNNG
jgi:putative phosphoesterase